MEIKENINIQDDKVTRGERGVRLLKVFRIIRDVFRIF